MAVAHLTLIAISHKVKHFSLMNTILLNNPQYHLFSQWEPYLKQIVSRYPEPSKIYCSGKSPSTVRQNLLQAFHIFVANPSSSSVIDHDQAQILLRTFVFSQDPDGTVYIGPRRGRKMRGGVTVNDLSSAPPPIPPIDCSNPITLNAILHLKNFDLLPVPITLTNFTPPIDIQDNYPNVEIVPNADGSSTIL